MGVGVLPSWRYYKARSADELRRAMSRCWGQDNIVNILGIGLKQQEAKSDEEVISWRADVRTVRTERAHLGIISLKE
jgi:hypothetical protein